MGNKNLGLSIADSAVASVNSLNNSPRSIELYEKIRLAQEENDQVANEQRKKAFSYGLSASVSMALNLVGEVFKNAGNPLGEALNSLARTTPEIAKVRSTSLDGSITDHSHTSRVADTAAQRITQNQSTTETLIGRNVEQISRLLSKEV